MRRCFCLFMVVLVGGCSGYGVAYTEPSGDSLDEPSSSGNEASLSWSASSLAFGEQVVGTTSEARTLTISNPKRQDVRITSISVSGPFKAMTPALPVTLGRGGSISVGLTFAPIVVGQASGQVTVVKSSGTNEVAALTGYGVSPAATVTCGDGTCAASEDCQSCAADCGSCPVQQTCVTSTSSWQNVSFTAQTGGFSLQFDATPSVAGLDMVIGVSNGIADAYADLGAIVRFNASNTIDARNGSAYAAASAIPYVAGTKYHFRLAIDLGSRLYSAFVTAPGGVETAIGSNFAFRTEQSTASSLSNVGVYAFSSLGSGGTVCDVTLSSPTPAPADTTAPTVSITSPTAFTTYSSAITAVISASAADNIGVTKVEFYDGASLKGTDTSSPYSFAWSFTSANNGTHVWTAKAYDAAGNSAVSAGVSVTVAISTTTTAPEIYFQGDMENVVISGDQVYGWEALAANPLIDYADLFWIGSTNTVKIVSNLDGNRKAMQMTLSSSSNGVAKVNWGMAFNDNTELPIYHTSHRMYINEAFQYVADNYPGAITTGTPWMTIMEIFNEEASDMEKYEGASARWTLALDKEPRDALGNPKPWTWELKGEYMQPPELAYDTLFSKKNTTYRLPIEKWFTLDLYMKRGEADGRMILTITPDGGPTEVLIDVTGPTIYPGRPDLQVTSLQPLKIYTDSSLMTWVTNAGRKLQISYNDFKWFKQ